MSNNIELYIIFIYHTHLRQIIFLTVPKDYTNRASIVFVIIHECIEAFLYTSLISILHPLY